MQHCLHLKDEPHVKAGGRQKAMERAEKDLGKETRMPKGEKGGGARWESGRSSS